MSYCDIYMALKYFENTPLYYMFSAVYTYGACNEMLIKFHIDVQKAARSDNKYFSMRLLMYGLQQ